MKPKGRKPIAKDWYASSECSPGTEERYLLETLAVLQASYAKMAKPYIDRLEVINAMRPPAPMIVTLEQAQALGLLIGE